MKKIIFLVILIFFLPRLCTGQGMGYFDMASLEISQATDATPLVVEALKICQEKGYTGLRFPKGTYHFYPTYAPDFYCAITNNDNGLKRTPFPLFGFHNFHVDGGGSEFLFHGKMIPFIIEESSSLKVTDLSIDWEQPFFLQGAVVAHNQAEKTFDIEVETPFRVHNDRLFLKIEREYSPYEERFGHRYAMQEKYHQMVGQNIIWDKQTKAPIYKHNLYSGFENDFFFPASLVSEKVVRLKSKYAQMPPVGSVFISKGEYLFNRQSPAFRIFKSKDLLLKNVNVHHAGAMGLIAERSENITLNSFNVVLREGSGRLVTTVADATHFCNCKGLITIENCTFENMLDDATNIHGTHARVNKVLGDRQVVYGTYHPHQKDYLFGEKGDSVRVIDQKTLLPKSAVLVIENVQRINESLSILTFDRSVKGLVEPYDGIDNISWQASALIQNNTVRNNRARGFLISTGRKVEVRNNTIAAQMAAMRMTGDLNLWNESGPCDSLIIENNRFVNNIHGGNKQAVLLIDPEQDLSGHTGESFYSKNIIIRNNEFHAFDSPVLKAQSVDGLVFQANKIIQTDAYKPLFPDEPNIKISNCRNIVLENNKYQLLDGKYMEISIEKDF